MYYKEYCKHVQNRTIDAIYEARTNAHDSITLPISSNNNTLEEIPLFSYVPKYVDAECKMVNQLVGRIVNDPYFSWYESKYNERKIRTGFAREDPSTYSVGLPEEYGLNCFGIPPISNAVTFAKIDTILDTRSNQPYNVCVLTPGSTIPDPLNSVITNLWIELDNPTHATLNELVSYIEMHYGSNRVEIYRSNDIETEINVLCYLFKYETITYKDGKIRIPLIFPYNVPIFLQSYHEFSITIYSKGTPDKITYNVYGCIHPTSEFTSLKHTTSMTHNCISLFYEHQCAGEYMIQSCDQTNTNDFHLYFNHPCYVLFVTGLQRDKIIDIQLVMKARVGVVDYRSIYDENDITIIPVQEREWIKEHDRDVLILYFNKRFLEYDQIQDSVNFSQLYDTFLRITKTPPSAKRLVDLVVEGFPPSDKTPPSAKRLVDLVVEGYSEQKPSEHEPIVSPMHINIFAVNANIMRHRDGMTGFLYKN